MKGFPRRFFGDFLPGRAVSESVPQRAKQTGIFPYLLGCGTAKIELEQKTTSLNSII